MTQAQHTQSPDAQVWEFLRDDQTGAGIPRPPRWQRPGDGTAVITLVDPHLGRDGAFRPNVNVVVERPHPDLLDLDSFTGQSLRNMRGGLTDLHLIDVAAAELSGHAGHHVTSVYRSGVYALALEQWWTVVAGLGTTLTATCAVEDYARMAPVFETIAAGLVPATRVPASGGAGA